MVVNPRQILLEEGIDKIRGGKGMILKGFKTEKTRVEEHLRNINFYYPEENSKTTIIKNNKETEEVIMKQPVLRFKPRTDLERIFEEINKNSFRKLDRNIIEQQIKNIDKVKKGEIKDDNKDEIPDYKDATKLEDDYDDFDYLGIKKDVKEDKNKLEMERRNKLIKSRKKDLNSNAKNLMKELHNKTHFKGVTSLTNFNSPGNE